MQKHSFYLAIQSSSRNPGDYPPFQKKIKKIKKNVFHKITAPQNQDTKFPPIE